MSIECFGEGGDRRMLTSLHKRIRALTIFLLFSFLGMANPTYAQGSNAPSVPFSVGQCWQVDVAKNVPSTFWNGSGPVNCSKPHNGYTHAVLILPTNYPDPYKKKYSTQEQAIKDKFAAKNPDPLAKLQANSRVEGAIYFPTKAQWLSGERWERFDLGIAAFGSPLTPYNKVLWAPLPTNIKILFNGIEHGLPEFKFCTKTPSVGDVANGPSAVFADCRANPMHQFLASANIAKSAGEKYPGDKEVDLRAAKFCKPYSKNAGKEVTSWSNEAGWKMGQTFVWCWQNTDLGSAIGPYSVGQCWKVSESKNLPSNFWNGSDPVSCQTSHNAYTYGVWSLTKDIKSLPVRGSAADNSIRDGCTYQTPLALPNNRVTTIVYYPSPKQWAAGVRTYRCDLGLYQLGSLTSNPKWGPLPTDMKKMLSDLTKKSLLYQYCVRSSAPSLMPMHDMKAVYVDCNGKYSYHLLGSVNLLNTNGEKYPGDAAIQTRASAGCGKLTRNVVASSFESLNKGMWDAGTTWIFCWQVPR